MVEERGWHDLQYVGLGDWGGDSSDLVRICEVIVTGSGFKPFCNLLFVSCSFPRFGVPPWARVLGLSVRRGRYFFSHLSELTSGGLGLKWGTR